MAYNVNNDRAREYVFGIKWGDLYGKPGPLTTLCRDDDLSGEEKEILSSAPVKIRPPLVKGAKIPDLLGVGPYIVSDQALGIILELQPRGIVPIPLGMAREEDDAPVPGYSILQVRTFLDCIDFDKTHFLGGAGFDAAFESGFRISYGGTFVLKRAATIDSHLWRAAGLAKSLYFISDALRDRFDEAGIHGWGFKACSWSMNS
jgi:hypothetical protein